MAVYDVSSVECVLYTDKQPCDVHVSPPCTGTNPKHVSSIEFVLYTDIQQCGVHMSAPVHTHKSTGHATLRQSLKRQCPSIFATE